MKSKWIKILALACAFAAQPGLADESYPTRPVTVVVPFAAGSGTDVITRLITDKMGKSMGTAIIVDNKSGANGQIGTEFVARAHPDGYTLLVATNSTHSANPFLYTSLRYDPLKSLEPVGRMTVNPLALLVNQNSQFKDTQALLAYARANPGKLSYGYGNTGGQVSGAMLVNLGKINALAVPYKTTPQVFTDLIAGQVDFAFVDLAASQPLIQAGKLRALAVSSPKRFGTMPKVPAVRETAGMEDFSLFAWLGLMAPAGTPKPIVEKLSAELRKALDDPAVRQQLEQRTGSIVDATSTEEFGKFLRDQSALWKLRIGEAGIQPE